MRELHLNAECKARLAELKARIAALDDERTTIAAEIATLEQTQTSEMSLPGFRLIPSLRIDFIDTGVLNECQK